MDRTAQHIELPDGRTLGFAEFGKVDGTPVFYNHGFPASRLEARLVENQATEIGVRLIAVDRPGLGLSTPKPGRTLSDWPADIACLADHLGLDRFAMLGVSGGGPATLACAFHLAERLTAVSVACGLGQVAEADLRRLMHWPARISFGIARRFPSLARVLYGNLIGPLLGRSPGLTLRLLTVAAPDADARVLNDATIRQRLADSLREAFRQGGKGPTAELILQATPWPFPIGGIRLPVELWHGRKDATVPFRHAEVLAKRLAQVRCHEFLNEGHFSLPIRNAAAILGNLRDRHLDRIAPSSTE